METLARTFGGSTPDHATLAAIACAVPGADVDVVAEKPRKGKPPTMSLNYEHDGVEATRTLYRNRHGKTVCHNEFFEIRDNSPHKGKGAQVFHEQVQALQKAGVDHIETEAARGPKLNGYYTWVRLGYDGPIPENSLLRMPSGLRSKLNEKSTLLDLLDLPEGRQWWKDRGESVDVKFDLTPGSRSLQVLEKYLDERKQKQ